MRWVISAACWLATAALSFSGSTSLVTWNMQHFPGRKPTSTPEMKALHMSKAKDALLTLKPDIFCAQEIRNWEVFDELTSVVPSLVPLIVSSHPDSRYGGATASQQIGIAAKWPPLGAWSEVFQFSEDTPPRGFSFVALDVGDGATLLIYSVHLKSNMQRKDSDRADNLAKRVDGANQILKHAEKMEQAYKNVLATIICGDFNTDPTDPEFSDEETFQLFYDAGFKWPWTGVP